MTNASFRRLSLATLFFSWAVIVWGAYVRVSLSGDGCGAHWPLCNGAVVPAAPAFKTMVELGHRVTSGISLLMVVGLFLLSRRIERGHPARKAASATLFFMITEALVGAALVLLRKVALDASIGRAAWMSVHLVNTFLMLGAMVATVYFAHGGAWPRWSERGRLGRFLGATTFAFLALGVSGALAALGDTLYPAASLAAGIAQDFSGASPFLLKLRLVHPGIAMTLSLWITIVVAVVAASSRERAVRLPAYGLGVCFVIQLGLGLLNVALLAPAWMQLVHLAFADLVWMLFVWMSLAALSHAPAAARDAVASWPPSAASVHSAP